MTHLQQSQTSAEIVIATERKKFDQQTKRLMKQEHNSAVLVLYKMIEVLEMKLKQVTSKVNDMEVELAHLRLGEAETRKQITNTNNRINKIPGYIDEVTSAKPR